MAGIGLRLDAKALEEMPRVGQTHHEVDIANVGDRGSVQRDRRAANDPPGFGRIGHDVGKHRQCFFEVRRQIHA